VATRPRHSIGDRVTSPAGQRRHFGFARARRQPQMATIGKFDITPDYMDLAFLGTPALNDEFRADRKPAGELT
jgi:hypothetical protein